MKLRKAVIPCAGLGTRMLPYSSTVPKELLPIGTLPVFHFVLCEAVAAGIDTVVLVNAAWKTNLENYLQLEPELVESLEKSGKMNALEPILKLRERLDIVSVRQEKSLGLGHAIGCAGPVVGDEPFAVLLPDELVLQSPAVLVDLADSAQDGSGAVALMEVAEEDVSRYGIANVDDSGRILDLVEKPRPEAAPSRLAIVGRYVFPAKFQRRLKSLKPGVGGELQLTDAMRENLDEFPLLGVPVTGRRFDTGNPEGYARTWAAYLDDPRSFTDYVDQCVA